MEGIGPAAESQRLRSALSEHKTHGSPGLPDFTDDNFVTEVLDAKELVVFDFWTERCSSCKVFYEALQRLSALHGKAIKCGRVHVQKNPELVKAFNLKAVPHLVVMFSGNIQLEIVGDRPFDELRDKIAPFVR